MSLIKYINQKDNISDVFLGKLKEKSENEISKLNKICPIVFQREKKEELFKENLKQKITEKNNNEAFELKMCLEDYQRKFKNSSRIFKDYEKYQNTRDDKYGDLHKDYGKKYWDKIHIDKLLCKNLSEYRDSLSQYKENEERMKFYK